MNSNIFLVQRSQRRAQNKSFFFGRDKERLLFESNKSSYKSTQKLQQNSGENSVNSRQKGISFRQTIRIFFAFLLNCYLFVWNLYYFKHKYRMFSPLLSKYLY